MVAAKYRADMYGFTYTDGVPYMEFVELVLSVPVQSNLVNLHEPNRVLMLKYRGTVFPLTWLLVILFDGSKMPCTHCGLTELIAARCS